MPAPRPASSLSTRSKTSTSQPCLRSSNPASRPLIEPPTTSARRCPEVAKTATISRRAGTCYIPRESSQEECHGPHHVGQESREFRPFGLVGRAAGGIRAGAPESQPVRGLNAPLGE